MDLEKLKLLVELLSGSAALLGGLLAALWAYSKFVLERSLLPPVQFDVSCSAVGRQKDRAVLEIQLHLKNVGSSALVASDIRLDLLYLDEHDKPQLFDDRQKPTFGRLRFPHSLRRDLASSSTPPDLADDAGKSSVEPRPEGRGRDRRGIPVLDYDTFVQPGVDQLYAFITTVPAGTSFVLVWSSFRYAQRPSRFQEAIVFLSRWLGLLQYSLAHVRRPHTVERVFPVSVANSTQATTAEGASPSEGSPQHPAEKQCR
jgi:hypothetical protein